MKMKIGDVEVDWYWLWLRWRYQFYRLLDSFVAVVTFGFVEPIWHLNASDDFMFYGMNLWRTQWTAKMTPEEIVESDKYELENPDECF